MFWRGVWGYLPVQAVQAALGFGSIIAFTRLLPPESYGHYALAFSVASILQCLFLTWLDAALERFQVAERERGDAAAHMATLRRLMATMIGALLAVALPLLAVLPLDRELRLAAAIGVVAWSMSSFLKLFTGRMRAEGEVRAYALLDISTALGAFLLGVALALAGWGAAGPMAGLAIALAGALLFIAPREHRRHGGGRYEPQRIRAYARYGVPVALSLILSQVLASTDRFVIAAFLDEAAVGAYHAGYSLGARILDVVFVWIGLAGAPALVAALERAGPQALQRAAREQVELMILLGLPAAAGLALVAEPLNHLLVGEALRHDSARITPWIALGSLFAGVTTHYLYQAFTLGRRTGLLLLAMTIPAGFNLVLNLILVPRFGLMGAAWATSASLVAGALSAVLIGRPVTPLPLPWATIGRCGLATAGMAAMVLLLPSSSAWTELLLKSGTGVTVYAVLVLAIDRRARSRAADLLRVLQARPA